MNQNSVIWSLCCFIFLTNQNDAQIVNKFSTKNTYSASFTNSSTSDAGSGKVGQCQPVQVLMLSRHGIRYPGADDILAAEIVTKQFQSHGVDPSIVKSLQLVLSRDLPIAKEKQLSKTGAQEQQNLGFRFAEKFLPLFSSARSNEVTFVSSSSKRARDSCKNYQKGFVEALGLNISMEMKINDTLTRFFDFCPKYLREVKKNETALFEQVEFEEEKKGEINEHIGKHLKVSSRLNLTADDLNSLYKVAGCEFAIVETHHWLNLLNHADLDMLEYREDLESYWELAYGYPINYQQSCVLLSDMFDRMEDLVSGKPSSQKGIFYFGHAETVVPLLALLGLYKDDVAPRAKNYDTQQNRSFKTSHISPFSTNLAFVLYKCNSTVERGTEGTFMVQLLFKEQPITIPHACSSDLCPYDVLRKYFSKSINCDFKATCFQIDLRSSMRLVLLTAFLLIISHYFN